jgi:hypothetical protein
MLTQEMPFPSLHILFQYYEGRIEFPRSIMLSKNTSSQGIEFVECMLASVPASRIAAEEALGHMWLLAEDEEAMEPEKKAQTAQTTDGGPAIPGTDTTGEGLLPHTLEATGKESPTRDVVDHFVQVVFPIILPILDLHLDAKWDKIPPALGTNEWYRACCLSIAARHLKATQLGGLQGEEWIIRHWYPAISGLCDGLAQDQEHLQILGATLGMILFQVTIDLPPEKK